MTASHASGRMASICWTRSDRDHRISHYKSSWETRLPAELLRLPEGLARADPLLDDPAFFAPFGHYFHPVLGQPSAPVRCYLRQVTSAELARSAVRPV